MNNPTKDRKGSSRVARGGYWDYDPKNVRASSRSGYDPAYQNYDLGFRIVRNKV